MTRESHAIIAFSDACCKICLPFRIAQDLESEYEYPTMRVYFTHL